MTSLDNQSKPSVSVISVEEIRAAFGNMKDGTHPNVLGVANEFGQEPLPVSANKMAEVLPLLTKAQTGRICDAGPGYVLVVWYDQNFNFAYVPQSSMGQATQENIPATIQIDRNILECVGKDADTISSDIDAIHTQAIDVLDRTTLEQG